MPTNKASKLCKSLLEILKDRHSRLSMLDYFIQYAESVGALHIVQFWLCVESFRATGRSPEKPPSPPKAGDYRTRPNTILDKSGRILSHESSTSPSSSEVVCLMKGNGSPGESARVGSVTEKSHGRSRDGGSMIPSPHSSNGSPRMRRHPLHVGPTTPGSSPGSPGSPGSPSSTGKEKHRVLQRRDTENHKYCNCRIHAQQGSPSFIHGVGCGGGMADSNNGGGGSGGSSELYYNSINHSPAVVTSKPLDESTPVNKANQSLSASSRSNGSSLRSRMGSQQHSNNHLQSQYHSPKILDLESDALGIYSSYLALNATKPVGVTDEIRQRVEVNICPEDGKIDNSCFDEAQDYVYRILETRFYPGFLQSPFLCKYQLDYIASGALNLVDFLLGENALFYFMEFMEQEGASTLLQFWLTAENFYNHLSSPEHTPNAEVDTADAIAIYDRYFSLQATEPLRMMEDSIRMDVENRICDEHGPRPDSYLRPQLVAFHTMNEVYFPAFIGSSVYLRFLNELVQMLNKDDESTPTNSSSTTTAESRKASTETELKMGPTIMGKDLDDPDSLWERPAFLFRLGFVNELGEYVSEVEQVSVRNPKKDNSWSVSSRVLRKRKKEEELAMKIAKNIIIEVRNCIDSSSKVS